MIPDFLNPVFAKTDITEILFNDRSTIFIEEAGRLTKLEGGFETDAAYLDFLDILAFEAGIHVNKERPLNQGRWRDFRVQLIGSEVSLTDPTLSLRRMNPASWQIQTLVENGFLSEEALELVQEIFVSKKNCLVIGATGSGKTTLLNACIKLCPENERVVILEDTNELHLPNQASARLKTRWDVNGVLPSIQLDDLVKLSLRMRPDRLVIGEVRGGEAKDLLLALATGHGGSWATIHAETPQQAILRLEMLVQMGAPQWATATVQRLIFESVQYIMLAKKNPQGRRQLEGIWKLAGLEPCGFLIERVYGCS